MGVFGRGTFESIQFDTVEEMILEVGVERGKE